jgi:hypothetical protein
MHHKEVCLAVDTAKLILAAFPPSQHPDLSPMKNGNAAGEGLVGQGKVGEAWLVVGGMGREHQPSMEMLMSSAERNRLLVLFPSDDSVTFEELSGARATGSKAPGSQVSMDADSCVSTSTGGVGDWDVVVIDGTWAQARKLMRGIPLLETCQKVI